MKSIETTDTSINGAMHPYSALPQSSYWRRSIEGRTPFQIDPVTDCRLKIGRTTKVATAGSCFAQRIGQELSRRGYGILRTEEAPADDPANPFYRLFSAAYGNIYTTLQLRQLLTRAYGLFRPATRVWRTGSGRYVDPFRPALRQDGFASEAEVLRSQEQHLGCVRRLLEECDVFIFTLGLTEAWVGPDGEAITVVPGAVDAEAYGESYGFFNMTAEAVRNQLMSFVDDLKLVNPGVSVILTVSPVAMIATYEPRHVLVSNTFSKAALRVASDEVCRARDFVHYFPSYEIVAGQQCRGAFYRDDARGVTDDGVRHIMAVFSRHFFDDGADPASETRLSPDIYCAVSRNGPSIAPHDTDAVSQFLATEYKAAAAVICDEELLG